MFENTFICLFVLYKLNDKNFYIMYGLKSRNKPILVVKELIE